MRNQTRHRVQFVAPDQPTARAVKICVVLFPLLALAAPAHGFTIRRVPSEYPTIQAAVTAAAGGDSILIAPGTYSGAGNRGIAPGQKVVYIRGEGGPGSVVIDAEGLDNGITFTEFAGASSFVQDVTIRNGDPYGIYVYMVSPTIYRCRVENCESGILLADNDGLVATCTVEWCRNSGVVVTTGSDCRIQNTQIRNNDGQYGAGLEVISANPRVENCTINGNDASVEGGGVYAENSAVTIGFTTISGNRAAGVGGGMRLLNGSAAIDTSTIARNRTVVLGGGVYGTGTSITFTGSILWANCTSGGGHEMFVDGSSAAHFACSAVDLTGLSGSGGITFISAIYADPLFCDPGPCDTAPTVWGDFQLATGSPCLGGACGRVGAWGSSCSETLVRQTTWGWIRASFR